jgi:hypothetical protein
MPSYKVLGQLNPTSGSLQTLYTAPREAVISTLAVCNVSSSVTTFRVAVRPGGEAIANKHYVSYDTSINGNDTVLMTIGMTLSGSDAVSVLAGSTGLAFNLFGTEI